MRPILLLTALLLTGCRTSTRIPLPMDPNDPNLAAVLNSARPEARGEAALLYLYGRTIPALQ